jgi:hypothetical protein
MHHAKPEDFTRWAEKAASMSLESLNWSINDCWQASLCAREIGNAIAEGRYLDEMYAYASERKNRAK